MTPGSKTVLITGGGSGIGFGLATALDAAGHKVVIAGRRRSALDAVAISHPGISGVELDVADAASIAAAAATLRRDHPALDVVIHNAAIMRRETLTDGDVADAEATIATNLLGPIRLTAALLPQLLQQPAATVITVSSGLAFVPLALVPTYCATKAAIHSWSQSLRHQLKATRIDVVEIIPPYVQTELLSESQAVDPRAMPLANFITEVMPLLTSGAEEIVVERCRALRFAAESGAYERIYAGVNAMEH